jgi:ADP-heptose:LPS heptosyltransferase
MEWNRVLKPGGKLFFRTPDLEHICRMYLEGKKTKEHPDDEKFIKANFGEVTPAWWANIKLFAGQGYEGNTHYFAFDYDMAKGLLERFGFENIERVHIKPEFSPGELQVLAYKKKVKDKAVVVPKSEEHERILVRRKGALGDVLLTTPIVRRLREVYGTQAIIDVATNSGSVYINNHSINNVLPGNASPQGYSKFIDLDFAYEKRPKQHIIESYIDVAFGDEGRDFDKSTQLFPCEGDVNYVDSMLKQNKLNPFEFLVFHMGVTWKNRTWPREYWHMALRKIAANGNKIVVIGMGSDFYIDNVNTYNFKNKFSIQQLSYLISQAKCFVGNDSGMLHVAGTTPTKIVGIFTSAKGEYRVPFREGEYGYNTEILKPQVDCYGCLHLEKPPVVYVGCKRSDFICLKQITPDMVARAIG